MAPFYRRPRRRVAAAHGGLAAAATMPALRPVMPSAQPFALRGDHITLDALLKACGVAGSGGEAKLRIAAGEVSVNGEVELRRGRKLRAGDVVDVDGQRIAVQAG